MEELEERICSQCGNVNPGSLETCRSCGNLLSSSGTHAPDEEYDDDPGNRTVMVFAREFAPRRFRLVRIDEDGRELERFDVEDGSVVGRTTGDIQLPDRHVSRRHCSFSVQNGHLYLKDLNSTNGVFVRVRRSTRVKIPVELMIGHTICRVVVKS